MQVMLDRDLAELYGVETKVLNQAVKRNIDRFPDDFRFQINDGEKNELVTNCDRLKTLKHSSSNPYAFTEQGVSMLATVLKSKVAVEVRISIIRAFVQMRKFLLSNASILQRLDHVEYKLLEHDKNFNTIFQAIEDKSIKPTQGIFFDGQIFDAYELVSKLVKSAKIFIKLIDNYIDESVLTLFSKVPNIKVTIYTKSLTKQLKLDLQKYNAQYKNIEIKAFKSSHDRFLIIDNKEVYHIGASLKDLGKKWFAFSKMDRDSLNILERLP